MGIILDFGAVCLMGFSGMGAIFALAALGNGSGSLVKNPELLWVGVICCLIPLLLAVIYLWRGWSFFGMSPKIFAGICVATFFALALIGNIFKTVPLVLRGIEPFGYVVMKETIYYNGNKLEEAELSTFKILDPRLLAFDAKNVFYRGKIIPGAHGASFQVIDEYFQKDRSQVFRYFEKLEGADPKHFRVLGLDIAVSGKNIFLSGKIIENLDGEKLRPIASWCFQHGSELLNSQFKPINFAGLSPRLDSLKEVPASAAGYRSSALVDGSGAYFIRNQADKGLPVLKIIPGADANTFRYLEDYYYAEARKVFYLGEDAWELPGADPEKFRFLNSQVAVTENSAFIKGKKVADIDVKKIRVISEELFQQDDLLFDYWLEKVDIEGSPPRLDDLEKVTHKKSDTLRGKLFSDGGGVYILQRSNESRRTVLRRLQEIDAPTFEHLFSNYYADESKVYYLDGELKQIAGADRETFEESIITHLSSGITRDARDKNRNYLSGK